MQAQRGISVLSIALPLIILVVFHVQAAQVQLSWTAPTTNADGTPLTDLAGYNVYYGLVSRSYVVSIDVGLTTTATLSGLEVGRTYYFTVTAYDWAGNESAFSGEVAHTLSGGSIALFEDDFQRPDSGVVGNGWVEVESSSRTRIVNGRLVFNAVNDSFRPLLRHAFPARTSGILTWAFDLNFQRSGPENYYSFRMQLGEGTLMSDTNPMEQGVAVNLIWGSPSHGLTTHEGFGYIVNGTITQIATVSGGEETITVSVDLVRRTYSISVGGKQVTGIPFDENVSAIDTVRFFAHELHRDNFALREVDNVVVW